MGMENVDPKDLKPNLEFDYESESEFDDEPTEQQPTKPGLLSRFDNNFYKPLEMKDIESVLAQLSNYLIAKDVAAEIAVKLTNSVGQSLIGKRVNLWIGLKSFVKNFQFEPPHTRWHTLQGTSSLCDHVLRYGQC